MSQSASPAAGRGGHSQHELRSNPERRRVAAVTAESASPSSKKTTRKVTTNSTVAKGRGGKSPALSRTVGMEEEEEEQSEDNWKERFTAMEKQLTIMKEEGEKMKAEIRDLRDRLEEEAWAKSRLEGKIEELAEKLKEVEKKLGEGGGGGGGNEGRFVKVREESRKGIKDVEDRLEAKIKQLEEGGGGGVRREDNQVGNREESQTGKPKQRCIVITDSNGREATGDSIKNHVPRNKRDEMVIEVAVAYTLEEAYRRISRGELSVEEAIVVVDNLTNDVRGTRNRPSVTPQQLVRLIDALRRKVMAAGATAVIVCQLKPMQMTDVTPYNEALDTYLRREKQHGRDGYACRTQIRLDYLRGDGFHLKPDYWSVLDRTYACALLGCEVPFPTPWDEFAPGFVRRRWEVDWPRLTAGGSQMTHHGR